MLDLTWLLTLEQGPALSVCLSTFAVTPRSPGKGALAVLCCDGPFSAETQLLGRGRSHCLTRSFPVLFFF